ncbi:MAG: ATP synthase F1 subunit gamma [Patescibacteria group bacterium]
MANIKEIQRRIKSISNTKKVTRAMEMVAATKMHKAVESVLRTRTYANLSWVTILNLSKAVNFQHPLLATSKDHKPLKKGEGKPKLGIILITSNRGLCGGFNSAIINKTHKSIKLHSSIKSQKTDIIIIGKKGAAIRKYYGYDIVADFPKEDGISEVKEVLPISKIVIDDFLKGKYDKIFVAYTDFVNTNRQIPRVKQILPIDISTQDEFLGVVGEDTRLGLDKEFIEKKQEKYLKDGKNIYKYTFEPSPKEVFDEMIPRLIEIQLFQALLESNASEHSARMTAMHQATEAANDLVNELTLFYNKARQASITAEIAEISAGANALAE